MVHEPTMAAPYSPNRAAGRAQVAKRATARAADLAPIIEEIQAAGTVSLRGIAVALNERGISTPRGHGEWSAVQVNRVLKRAMKRDHDADSPRPGYARIGCFARSCSAQISEANGSKPDTSLTFLDPTLVTQSGYWTKRRVVTDNYREVQPVGFGDLFDQLKFH
jgi:hypothetical protein